jgi:hypothetical protein
MTLSTQDAPALSALVIIPDASEKEIRILHSLANQTAASRMEVVVVMPYDAAVRIPPETRRVFRRVRLIELPTITYGGAMAAGVRGASAAIVAFTEDHAYPDRNWAERLIEAHALSYSVVGPAMRCGNTQTLVGLADFYMGYGAWAMPIESGEQEYLMAHNASYKRDVLMAYGEQLENKLEAEIAMQFELARRGHKFWLEARTCTTHLNIERWASWRRFVVFFGRSFAGQRSAEWSPARRAVFALGSFLIPFVRFARVRNHVRRSALPRGRRLRLYPVIFAGLCLDAVGQGLGYALGAGATAKKTMEMEFHRERHLLGPIAGPAE